jgi:16S rRNA (cytidine1402-2'-O)-methyltransferase
VLPGASAVLAALTASGINAPGFYFGGFLPRKQQQTVALLQQLAPLDAALIFYESPHRIVKSLATIAACYPTREVVLARELTKLHEEVLRLPAQDLADQLASRDTVKGEIAIVIAPPLSAPKTHKDKYAASRTMVEY